MYDITKRSTFDRIEKWITELRENADPNVCVILVGNKSDLANERQVSQAEGTAIAAKHNMSFLEASALTAENVEECFRTVLEEIHKRVSEKPLQSDNRQPHAVEGDTVHLGDVPSKPAKPSSSSKCC